MTARERYEAAQAAWDALGVQARLSDAADECFTQWAVDHAPALLAMCKAALDDCEGGLSVRSVQALHTLDAMYTAALEADRE